MTGRSWSLAATSVREVGRVAVSHGGASRREDDGTCVACSAYHVSARFAGTAGPICSAWVVELDAPTAYHAVRAALTADDEAALIGVLIAVVGSDDVAGWVRRAFDDGRRAGAESVRAGMRDLLEVRGVRT